jgi:hypothetical protein
MTARLEDVADRLGVLVDDEQFEEMIRQLEREELRRLREILKRRAEACYSEQVGRVLLRPNR